MWRKCGRDYLPRRGVAAPPRGLPLAGAPLRADGLPPGGTKRLDVSFALALGLAGPASDLPLYAGFPPSDLPLYAGLPPSDLPLYAGLSPYGALPRGLSSV